jgi:hypothetical protein
MKRIVVLVAVLVVTGCRPNHAEPSEPDDGVGDFSGWPTATEKPIRVKSGLWLMCRAPTPEEERVLEAATEEDQKKHGPHNQFSIVVRTNHAAFVHFHARERLPVGAIVVKEKHQDFSATSPPVEYAAMIKREAGYDPEHRDWEYVFVVTQPERKVTRGKLESCIHCHSNAKDTDYLFRTYLPQP